jgi:5-methyltetrahydrofolate--homocysteine methyltransferase
MSSRFEAALRSGKVLLMDGAMGTQLQRAGLPPGQCPELWNLTHPERVLAIHRSYLEAGAEVLLTNTFQANPVALARHGQVGKLAEIWRAGIALARSAGAGTPFVLASAGPPPPADWLGPLAPIFASADGLLLETFSELEILDDVARLRRVFPHQVLFLSLTYRHGPAGLQTFSGHPPETFAARARQAGVTTLGVNCGREIDMEDIAEVIRRYRRATDLPLFARPNAGTPARSDEAWEYPHTPEKMAARLPALLQAGITLVGGCCGTTPDHLAAFRPTVNAWNTKSNAE